MAGTSLSSAQQLQFAEGNLLIEQASLRYLNWGDHELIRRIYPAVRDENWMTVPYTVKSGKLNVSTKGFDAEYKLHFISSTVDYTAVVTIHAEENQLSYSFAGTANREFLSNRIGICLLHPITTCAGRKVKVTHPDGSTSDSKFPERIAPHQPFINILGLEWTTDENVNVRVMFRGDIFETEDQRNWSDMSFKTYSTPLSVPFPRRISIGDQVEQSVVLQVNFPQHAKPLYDRIIHVMPSGKKFPAIGYTRPEYAVTLTEKERLLLKQLLFDHYRIDIDADTWSGESIKQVASEVKSLHIPVELVIHASWPSTRLKELIREIKGSGIFVEKILVLQKNSKITGHELWQDTISQLRDAFPAALYGAGTSANFTEINRLKPGLEKMSYIAFPNNPQVHADDDFTIIENLAAQAEIIRMAGVLYPGRQIHVSSVRLRYPNDPEGGRTGRYRLVNGYPWTVDSRQWSHFFARWIVLSLKYFAEADQLTYFDTVGLNGLMSGDNIQEDKPGYPPKHRIYPVYEAMAEIGAFRPVEIFPSFSAHPLHYDGYCLKNEKEGLLFVLVNHSAAEVPVRLINGLKELSSPEMKISAEENNPDFRTEPKPAPGAGYVPLEYSGSDIMLKPRSILYIRNR